MKLQNTHTQAPTHTHTTLKTTITHIVTHRVRQIYKTAFIKQEEIQTHATDRGWKTQRARSREFKSVMTFGLKTPRISTFPSLNMTQPHS